MPSRKSASWNPSPSELVALLNNHSANTLTSIVRIERIALQTSDPSIFYAPLLSATTHYITSRQFLSELRGLSPNYPFARDLVAEAYSRVCADPFSNRSWNMAWLVLVKMQTDGLVHAYAAAEAVKPAMWGRKAPSSDEVNQLRACFEYEWLAAVDRMLRHWDVPPAW